MGLTLYNHSSIKFFGTRSPFCLIGSFHFAQMIDSWSQTPLSLITVVLKALACVSPETEPRDSDLPSIHFLSTSNFPLRERSWSVHFLPRAYARKTSVIGASLWLREMAALFFPLRGHYLFLSPWGVIPPSILHIMNFAMNVNKETFGRRSELCWCVVLSFPGSDPCPAP